MPGPFLLFRNLLIQTRPHWDRSETRPAVRSAFAKALQCRTPELGAEVLASDNEEQVFCHSCKSRSCSSCGYRATVQWQRERWANTTKTRGFPVFSAFSIAL